MTPHENIANQITLYREMFMQLPNDEDQLIWAAAHLATGTFSCPKGWDKEYWRELCSKLYKERWAIAAAMLAVAIERANQPIKKKQP